MRRDLSNNDFFLVGYDGADEAKQQQQDPEASQAQGRSDHAGGEEQ